MNIFSRLIVSYIIILSIIVSANIYAIYQLGRFNLATRSILVIDNRMIDLQKKLTDSLFSQMRYEKKYLVTKDNALHNQFLSSKEDFENTLKIASFIADSDESRNLIAKTSDSYNQYLALIDKQNKELQLKQPYDTKEHDSQKELAITEAINALKDLEEYSRYNTYKKIQDLDAAVSNSRSIALIIILTTALLGIIISILITRSITKPLSIMKKKTREIAKGNFESTVTLSSPPEIGELADAFNYMCLKLKEVDKLKNDFFSLMSHELRTPLTSIQEGTNLLLEGVGGNVSDKQKKLLNIIAEEDKRLISLVNPLLDLSKMEAGMLEYRFAHAYIDPLITQILLEIEPIAQAKKIRLTECTVNSLPPVKIDTERISQVLRNLIGNAIKFTPVGGAVTVSTHAVDHTAEIHVSDTGPGIPQNDLERIFDKYQQVRLNNTINIKNGTGLGLAITKHIINAHGGKVWAKSTLEKGSTFIFSLPL